MSCDKGYQGQCCCGCAHLIPLHVCHCGHCSPVEGWICKIFYEMSRADGERGFMTHKVSEHGSCEMWTKRTLKENPSELESNKNL